MLLSRSFVRLSTQVLDDRKNALVNMTTVWGRLTLSIASCNSTPTLPITSQHFIAIVLYAKTEIGRRVVDLSEKRVSRLKNTTLEELLTVHYHPPAALAACQFVLSIFYHPPSLLPSPQHLLVSHHRQASPIYPLFGSLRLALLLRL
jgi:hypothetical protein